jgi:hypothetical protein
MAGLNHDFLLLSSRNFRIGYWSQDRQLPGGVQIHDDLLRYTSDTLKWIPSRVSSKQVPFQGLDFYGETWITSEGAGLTQRIFSSWADLFASGPDAFELTGSYCWTAEANPLVHSNTPAVAGSGHYERLTVDRNEIVDKFRTIASYAERMQKSEGELYILHLGI